MESALIYVADFNVSARDGMVLGTTDKGLQEDIKTMSPWVEDNALGTDQNLWKLTPGFYVWEGEFIPADNDEQEPRVETEKVRPATIADLQKFFPELK